MKLFNTYTNKLEDFHSIKENQVSMYVCGPTVYNYIHIGNARPVVVFDTLRRFFEAKGYTVRFASNFTDVDDRIIQKAIDEHKSEAEVSAFYIEQFIKDLERLGCKTDYIKPRVTEYIAQIIGYIEELVSLDFAYVVNGDVFFRVGKIDEYGTLSNRKLDDLISGARVEVNPDKESPLDFVLWKKTDVGLAWDSRFSRGRPGWHTECVVMIDDIFKGEIDIHGGGSDLIFPHHENEIAQAYALHEHHVARYWLHNGRLNIEGEKMSKSLGNFILVKDFPGDMMAFRLFLLSTHYRAPLNFNTEAFHAIQNDWMKTYQAYQTLFRTLDLADAFGSDMEVYDPDIRAMIDDFDHHLEQDLNTPNAISVLQALVKTINTQLRKDADIVLLKQSFKALGYMLSILGLSISLSLLSSEDKELYRKWEQMRKAKDFEQADRLRQLLQEKNIV